MMDIMRELDCPKILESLLAGDVLTRTDLILLSSNEQTSINKSIDVIRNEMYIPVVCGKNSDNETVWYMTNTQISDYHHDRANQVAMAKNYMNNKRDMRIVKYMVKLFKTDELQRFDDIQSKIAELIED